MHGLEAIKAANGFSMAIVGISIVFSGLVVLSFSIANIHKFIYLWENRGKIFNNSSKASPEDKKAKINHPKYCPQDIREAEEVYRPLLRELGSSFTLAELHKSCRENNFPHPHLTIKRFLEEKIIVDIGGGKFFWQQNK